MRRAHFFMLGTAAFLMLATTTMVVGQAPAARPPVKPLVDADNKRMQREQGLVSTTVFGDPNKPGIYVIRNRFAPGVTSRPHFHDQDRFVTVIKGTWWTDEGDVFRPDKMVPIKEGGFMYHPANYHHYDGSKGDEEVVVQIMGMGPVKTVQTEVDASGNPVRPKPPGQ
jgi:quercetin dioxygenase-like cupin family protein